MVRKIQFQFFRKNLQLFIKSQSFTATLQSLPTAQQLHFLLQTTPLTPEMSQEPTAVAGGRDLLHFDFRGFRRRPQHTCTSRAFVRTLWLPGPDSNPKCRIYRGKLLGFWYTF